MTVNFAGMSGFVSPNKPSIPPFSSGGIVEQKPEDKPNPFILEERPTTIDPNTGKIVYVDQLPKPGVCYFA